MAGRDYNELVRRLEALQVPHIKREVAGEVDGYPIYRVFLAAGAAPGNMLLSGGIHGDEYASPEAVLAFLERDHAVLLDHFRFLVFPCLNPYGYENGQRENREGKDLNRAFAGDGVPLVDLVKQTLEDQRFDFHMDFHEDWECEATYIYEAQRQERWIGPQVRDRVAETGPVDEEVEADKLPIAPGVFKIHPSWGQTGFTPYTYVHHTDHAMMTETPLGWPLEQRVAVHLKALDTVLEYCRS